MGSKGCDLVLAREDGNGRDAIPGRGGAEAGRLDASLVEEVLVLRR